MKRIILLAAFGVAGLISAKTADVKEKETEKKIEKFKKQQSAFRLCGVLVTFYDPKGNVTGSQWFLTDTETLSSCQAYQSFVLWQLNQSGYTLIP